MLAQTRSQHRVKRCALERGVTRTQSCSVSDNVCYCMMFEGGNAAKCRAPLCLHVHCAGHRDTLLACPETPIDAQAFLSQ